MITIETETLRDDELDAVAGGSTIGDIVGTVLKAATAVAIDGPPANQAAMDVWNTLSRQYNL
jgi:hypothetical protein